MSSVLVVNSGSSSAKYQLLDADSEQRLAVGLIERIGESTGHLTHTVDGHTHERDIRTADHEAGFTEMLHAFAEYGPSLDEHAPVAIGHRVVQGGTRYTDATRVTDAVERGIHELAEFAPLHNPANLAGIQAAAKAFPDVPQVAVFDTAFHSTLQPDAYTYAIDRSVASKYGVRRFGAHGTSYKYVSQRTAEYLGRDAADLNLIIFHLGNGASVCAVQGGRSVDTSMGFTPLEGLVMGTRSGDIDPAVALYLADDSRLGVAETDSVLNRRSGLLGLAGTNDLRDVSGAAAKGDPDATLAVQVYLRRIRHYLGAYLAVLGRVDAIVFTAGVGENSEPVRAGALRDLERLGIRLDPALNAVRSTDARRISADGSPIEVLVVPTDEELEIARQTLALLG